MSFRIDGAGVSSLDGVEQGFSHEALVAGQTLFAGERLRVRLTSRSRSTVLARFAAAAGDATFTVATSNSGWFLGLLVHRGIGGNTQACRKMPCPEG